MTPEQLRQARHTLNFNQTEMAHFLKLSYRQYSRYENGHSEIPGPVAILIDLAAAGRWKIKTPKPKS